MKKLMYRIVALLDENPHLKVLQYNENFIVYEVCLVSTVKVLDIRGLDYLKNEPRKELLNELNYLLLVSQLNIIDFINYINSFNTPWNSISASSVLIFINNLLGENDYKFSYDGIHVYCVYGSIKEILFFRESKRGGSWLINNNLISCKADFDVLSLDGYIKRCHRRLLSRIKDNRFDSSGISYNIKKHLEQYDFRDLRHMIMLKEQLDKEIKKEKMRLRKLRMNKNYKKFID